MLCVKCSIVLAILCSWRVLQRPLQGQRELSLPAAAVISTAAQAAVVKAQGVVIALAYPSNFASWWGKEPKVPG